MMRWTKSAPWMRDESRGHGLGGGRGEGGLMRDDYYGELSGAAARHRAVGWESEAAAVARYDAVARRIRDGERVLDLGAGLGELGRHLVRQVSDGGPAVRYTGLERDRRLVERGRLIEPTVELVLGDFMVDPLEVADVVVFVGALVDGASLRDDGVRFGRLRRMLERARAVARREVVLVVLDQDLLERDPVRSNERALGGLRLNEVPWLAPEAQVERVLASDLLVAIPGRAA